MQLLHTGDLVVVRRRRWRVAGVRPFDACQLVTLAGSGATNAGTERTVLAPFDAIDRVVSDGRVHFAGAARWRRVCRSAIAANHPPGALKVAAAMRLDLLPHQLEPALAIVRGFGSRVLLADEVGLGKTIEAGLIVAELRARRAADRVLILTPAGLRDQWASELDARFALPSEAVDFHIVRRRVSTLPVGVNPWHTWPIAIASVDYVKRPEVLPAVLSCRWDVVIVDEAHGVANDSARHAAVQALAARAPYVVLVTATPHNGERRAYESLCGIGAHDDRLLVFRRTRRTIRPGAGRRVRCASVRPNVPERLMHQLLAEFARAVRLERGDADPAVQLALAVLHKRAYSSAFSLAQTVARRLARLGEPVMESSQLMLPLDDRFGERSADDEPPDWTDAAALADAARERHLLGRLHRAAIAAAARETKFAAIVRLLNRRDEPAIVFTEYRDTLQRLAETLGRRVAVLHGGMVRGERVGALAAFASGRCPVLLATDAAGEGLNLHETCRTVINLELPWNPMRLEQRIGRVDRIGQRRTVHVFHLIARGTGEEIVLTRLRARVARASVDVGSPDPLGDAERDIARLVVIGGDAREEKGHDEAVADPSVAPVSLAPEAAAEARRLALSRMLAAPSVEIVGPLATIARNRTTRAHLAGRVLLVWRTSIVDADGIDVESMLIASVLADERVPVLRRSHESLLAWCDAVARKGDASIDRVAEGWRRRAREVTRAFVDARIQRERATALVGGQDVASLFQPGLFERRADQAHAASLGAAREAAATSAARIAMLERAAVLATPAPMLLLVLVG